MDLEVPIPNKQHLKSHLQCNPTNTLKGRSLQQIHTHVTSTTYAAKQVYVGHVGKQFIHRLWSDSQQKLHINLLELEAVFLTLKHLQPK